MRKNIYGLRLRSAVRSRRQRLIRSTIGVVILALLCLIYPGSRNLAAQLLGISTPPTAVTQVATDEPATLAAKRSPRHSLFNPLATDARAAAGLILPSLPPEPEFSAYASEGQPLLIDVDDAVSEEFHDVQPALIADAVGGGGGWWGARSGMVPRLGATGSPLGTHWAGANPDATTAASETIAASETPAGDERAGLLSDRASTAFASSATATPTLEAVSGSSGAAETLAGPAGHGGTTGNGGSTDSTASASTDGTVAPSTAFTETAPAEIAPAAMVIAELTAPPQARVDAAHDGASSTSMAGIAAAAPGVLADVPEPATLLLFGLGVAAAAYRTQSRRA